MRLRCITGRHASNSRYTCHILDTRLLEIDLYGGSKELLDRQALHCAHYGFDHPFTGERVEIEASLPADMQGLVDEKVE